MSSPLLQIDAAPAAHGYHAGLGVLHVQTESVTLLALFDAAGSWGHGLEAAKHTRLHLSERWSRSVPADIAAAEDDLRAACGAIPGELLDDDFGCAFCGVVVFVDDSGAVQVTAAGAFGVLLANDSGCVSLVRPRTLLDQLVEQGGLTPAEAEGITDYRDICVGPFLADGRELAPVRGGPHDILPGHVLLVAHHRLLRFLKTLPPSSWSHRPAAELRQIHPEGLLSACPLIAVRNLGSRTGERT